MKEISIVIPVYNSCENLEELSRQIHDSLQDFNFELIFVNDQSRDQSWKVIKELTTLSSNIIGINLRKNSGQDNAIMAGLNQAEGEYIVIMDDDLQHSPYDIPKLYAKCKEGFDICYANFYHKQQAVWKNLGSWINGKMAEILIHKPKHIYLSPFEIIHHDVIKEIIKYKGPYPYIQGLLLRTTQSCTQIDIEHHKRFKGQGNFNFIRSTIVFFKLITGFSIFPLRIATFVGFISAIIGFGMAIYYLSVYFFSPDKTVEGWTTSVVLLLFIGGLILISLGMIGEYIGRTFLSVNQKPQYSIRDIIKHH